MLGVGEVYRLRLYMLEGWQFFLDGGEKGQGFKMKKTEGLIKASHKKEGAQG